MYAIETVYKGPTDASGGRIVAREDMAELLRAERELRALG